MHIAITSSTHKRQPRADHTIACADLPNPHDVPAFRPRDGRDPKVKAWILGHPETQSLISAHLRHILAARPATVTVTCSAGRHRSVAVAEELARQLEELSHEVVVTHRELERAKARRDDGLGWEHQRNRRRLNANLVEGEPCWWCGRPMHRTHVLHADHTKARARGGDRADRLLHGACNEQRGSGGNDARRPALGRPDAFEFRPIRLKAGGVDVRFSGPTRPPEGLSSPRLGAEPFSWS